MTLGEQIILTTGDYPPYTSESDSGARVLQQLVKEAYKSVDIDVDYVYYPWKRALEAVKSGSIVGTLPWFWSEERDKDFVFPKEPLVEESEVIFHRKDLDFDWNNYDDLKNYKVGATVGYISTKTLTDQGIKLDTVTDEDLNFKKLLAKRIDIYPTSFTVGYYIIHSTFPPYQAALFTNHPKLIRKEKMYVLFSRKSPKGKEMADKLDIGLKTLKESGRYDEIFNEFGLFTK